MASEKQLVWYRFKTASVDDYRPIADMKEIGMPWWCTGWAVDHSYVIVVCYLPDGEVLSKYWPDACDIDMEYRDEIKYTERFPKPEWLEDNSVDKKRKICPMKLIGGQNSYAQEPFCDKEECAWWADYANDCCIPTIAAELADSTISRSCYKGGNLVYGI